MAKHTHGRIVLYIATILIASCTRSPQPEEAKEALAVSLRNDRTR